MTVRLMLSRTPKLAAALLLCLTLGALPGVAQTPEAMSVRGVVVSLDGAVLTVKTRQGADVPIKLVDNPRVVAVVKASIADIKPGAYIGASSVPREGSTSRALEIHILPEAARGAGEGDYPWDLAPGSSMTNGTVGNPVESVDGTTVTVSYKGDERKITILPDTSIVTYAPAEKSDIKAGIPVFLLARKQADDGWMAATVTVGKNGVAPPM
jgi:hypothetical protein